MTTFFADILEILQPLTRTPRQLRDDALAIWMAGVAAVDSARLVRESVQVHGSTLSIGDEEVDLASVRRIEVVGAGKAGAGMAAGIEAALGEPLMAEKQLAGWINVPADCLRPLQRIHLHAARPAGCNEPRPEGVAGAEEIMRRVASLGQNDLCICLISGGGSALLPLPVPGVTLEDKLAVTRFLSAAGATINELNTVRKKLSRIKGGGLARACRAGRLVALLISDVLGDPLDIIASGPTVVDTATAADPLAVLERFCAREAGISDRVFSHLAQGSAERPSAPGAQVTNIVIGNNAFAVDAAGVEAERRGYSHAMLSATRSEGDAEEVGRRLAEQTLAMLQGAGPNCLITGGEPVVRLVDAAERGLGGRNQQLVLAAFEVLAAAGAERFALLSGGVDGEDGPTDAAGAIIDGDAIAAASQRGLDAHDYLRRNDAYRFFEAIDALIKTGPTHTNVCDVRVVVVNR